MHGFEVCWALRLHDGRDALSHRGHRVGKTLAHGPKVSLRILFFSLEYKCCSWIARLLCCENLLVVLLTLRAFLLLYLFDCEIQVAWLLPPQKKQYHGSRRMLG